MTTKEQKLEEARFISTAFNGSNPDRDIERKRGIEIFIAGAEWAESQIRWIPVEEMLPPELVPVQVFIPDQDDLVCTAIYEKCEGWYEVYESVKIDNPVTHWQPSPAPPAKEDGRNE